MLKSKLTCPRADDNLDFVSGPITIKFDDNNSLFTIA